MINYTFILGLLFIAIRGIRTISNPEFWHLSHGKLGDLPLSYIQRCNRLMLVIYTILFFNHIFSLGGKNL